MILHLVHDEKIINRTISVFNNVFPDNNLFVVFTKETFKHVHRIPGVISYKEFDENYRQMTFSSVVIHYLNSSKIRFVNRNIDQNTPVYWIVWGADLYNNMLASLGFELFYKESTYFKSLRVPVLKRLRKYMKEKNKSLKFRNFLLRRVNFVVTDTTDNDYDMLVKYVPSAKRIPCKFFFYYPIDIILGESLLDKWVTGQNIQIGNSASFTNNHEYAMKFLSSLDLGERKIYVPLSYGGNAENTACVIKQGQKLFGDNFMPLTSFMPLDEYTKLMQSFNVAVYGNWRQEAIGNIIISMYLGAKVFLPKQNPIVEWARSHDLIFFELETISQPDLDTPLGDDDRNHNREILAGLYNTERMHRLILDLGLC